MAVRVKKSMREKYRRQFDWKARNPWHRYVEYARRRCGGRRGVGPRSDYSGRVVCVLTTAQAKMLWERYNAAAMTKPSLDRVDSKLGYTLENCRFIEHVANCRRAWDPEFDAELNKEGGTDGRIVEGADASGQCGRGLLRGEGEAAGGGVDSERDGESANYDAWSDPGLVAA